MQKKQQSQSQNKLPQSLIKEVQYYVECQDSEALQYLLEDESTQNLQALVLCLGKQEQVFVNQIISKLKSAQSQPDFVKDVLHEHSKIVSKPPVMNQESDDQDWLNYQKQFKVTDIVYGENFSYPFIGLIQKMVQTNLPKNHSGYQNEKIAKMIHSHIDTLFSYVFSESIKIVLAKKHRSVIKGLRDYLFFVFEEDYQKFISFSSLYKNIRKTMSSKQHTEKDIDRNLLMESSPLVSCQNQEQADYLLKIQDQLSESEYRQVSKLKSLNFMQFGAEKMLSFLDRKGFLPDSCPKQIVQLLSFISCRVLRRIVLASIRKRSKTGKLQFSDEETQLLLLMNVKIAGNEVIEIFKKKTQSFAKLEEPIEQIARRLFLQEYYEYEYASNIIPSSIIEQSQKAILNQGKIKTDVSVYIWQHFRQYRVLWMQRVAGERFINSKFMKSGQKELVANEYSRFIEKNRQDYQENSSLLWIKYMLMDHSPKNSAQRVDNIQKLSILGKKDQNNQRGRKKIKLQSLYS